MSGAASRRRDAVAWWTADGHVHSTFSDGASTLAEDVDAAVAVGLTHVTLVDHVRMTTTWVPEFVRAVEHLREEVVRSGRSIDIRCGVETKVLDRSGRLDLPDDLGGVDVVLIADHRFPGPDGPLDPAVVAGRLRDGDLDPEVVIEGLLGALGEAVGRSPLSAVLAHPLSILPKLGLDETSVPRDALQALATRCRETGTAVEVNEKWACPGPEIARLFHAAGVRLVAGSDAHHAAAVGRWRTVRDTLSAVLGPAPDGSDAPARSGVAPGAA